MSGEAIMWIVVYAILIPLAIKVEFDWRSIPKEDREKVE